MKKFITCAVIALVIACGFMSIIQTASAEAPSYAFSHYPSAYYGQPAPYQQFPGMAYQPAPYMPYQQFPQMPYQPYQNTQYQPYQNMQYPPAPSMAYVNPAYGTQAPSQHVTPTQMKTGYTRGEIRSMPITARPNRPGHFIGNTVRRRAGVSN